MKNLSSIESVHSHFLLEENLSIIDTLHPRCLMRPICDRTFLLTLINSEWLLITTNNYQKLVLDMMKALIRDVSLTDDTQSDIYIVIQSLIIRCHRNPQQGLVVTDAFHKKMLLVVLTIILHQYHFKSLRLLTSEIYLSGLNDITLYASVFNVTIMSCLILPEILFVSSIFFQRHYIHGLGPI
jgi:hypothetical protein